MKLKELFLKLYRTPLFWPFVFYFFSHLIQLTLLPVFNDEAIYLDWGWRGIHHSELLFFSLFDGKQPLLIWLFGLSEIVISSPLLAGRVVSVLLGGSTLIGLYFLTRRYFPHLKSWQILILSSVLPLAVFFDRQALMESAVSAIGVWCCYLTLRFLEKSELKYACYLGIVLGIGLFIKTTPVIFGLTSFILVTSSLIHETSENSQKRFIYFLIALTVSLIVLFPLYVQPGFSNIMTLNNRFSLSLKELFAFPLYEWLKHFIDTVSILFIYLTPLVFLSLMYSIWRILRRGTSSQKKLVWWWLIGLGIFILTVRNPSPRYLVSLLPLVAIFVIDGLSALLNQSSPLKKIGFGLLISLPAIVSSLLILTPLTYFQLMARVTAFSQQSDYVSDWTSGYGVSEACAYLTEQAKAQPITVLIRLDSGNPENSIISCFQNSDRVTVQYLPKQTTVAEVQQHLCQIADKNIYFASRDVQLLGLESLLIEQKKFMKPLGDKFVGVYQFKKCDAV